MAIEKGKGKPEQEKTESGQKNEQAPGVDLAAEFLKMKHELEQLKKQQAPMAVTNDGQLPTNQFATLVSEVVKAVREKPDSEKYDIRKFIDERDIDKDDYDAEGVTFSACSTGYVIVDDVKKGKNVRTPYGNVIFFRFQASRRTTSGKDVNLNTFSTYTSHSKKETQWLRDHRYYGIVFFESSREALNIEAKKAQKLVKYINALNSMGQHQIISACRDHNLPINDTDIRVMRVSLANKMAEEELRQEEVASGNRLKEQYENHIFQK